MNEFANQTPSVPDNSPGTAKSTLNFPVVGIGASAGGFQTVMRFLENMPSDNGMAFVVILHLSPKHHSNAANVIQPATRMNVVQVTEHVRIEQNHVYVIPPNKHLTMSDGHLSLSQLQRPPGQHVAIDLFMRTLADAHRERAVGIVLSGTGADGAIGLGRLKEQGGMTFAQLPSDAEFDGMPLAAISTGVVDFVMPVVDMPQKLLELWQNMKVIQLPPVDDPDAPLSLLPSAEDRHTAEQALQDVIAMLRSRTGHDFRHYKRATVLRRLERRLQVRGVATLPAYRQVLETDVSEGNALLKDMLIGVTNFFRDREAFEALEREVIPQIFEGKQQKEQVRAWVAACSTGEEAYSVAMLLSDQNNLALGQMDFQVFATDIDDNAIAVARAGTYPLSILADVPPSRLREYFIKDDTRYRIKKTLRDRVLFASHNLLRDPPFSRLDLISCRNLLIYLNREMQAQVLEMFHFALNPGGFLFLGNSESADIVAQHFTVVDKKNRIYRAKPIARSMRHGMPVPFAGLPRRTDMGVTTSSPEKQKFSFAEVHQRVLAEFAPPSVVVNYETQIVHMSDRVGRFLRHVAGEPSRNLVSLVYPELRLELRTALFQAMQSRKSVEARRVRLKRDDRQYYVNMVARPFHDATAGLDLVLVLFDEVEETMGVPADEAGTGSEDVVLTQLEQELQRTKENLQDTIERSQTSNEELRASNEELQSMIEELRSTTEELETSKEELQSVNEELITVNYELKVKVEETSKVNDDLNNFIASTDIATIFLDRGLRIKRFTPRTSELFNIIPADIGRSLLDITHRLDYDELTDDAATTFDTLRPVEREVRAVDGRCYIARLLPYRTLDDRIEGAVLTFINITARREAEEKVKAGEERMRLVAESTRDYAIITCDTEGRITSFNSGAERIFGYTEDEVLGQSGEIIYAEEDRANGVFEEEKRRARDEGRAEDERWHRRKDGSRLYCSGVMTPLREGKFLGYAKIARDRTGAAPHVSGTSAGEGALFRDEFLAVMSHELRHPLNLIHINTDLLSRLPEVRGSGVATKATNVIRRSVHSQAKIIDDLLDLSRLNTGRLSLTRTSVDLSTLVMAVCEAAQSDPATATLHIVTSGTEMPLVVHADLGRVEQILLNLLSNAIKFTPAGGTVKVKLTRADGMARIDVVDNGEGIPPEALPGIFDTFARLTPVTTRSKGGLGIGLALVREIAQLHGGQVEVTSPGTGQGACFTVWLPLEPALIASLEPAVNLPMRSIAGKRILLVEDMQETLSAMTALLEHEGATVHAASGGEEALKLLERHPVDAIVSDIAMPGMDGYAFIQEVRRRPALASLPAIALTGMGRPKDVERAIASGFTAQISKPVSMEALTDLLVRPNAA